VSPILSGRQWRVAYLAMYYASFRQVDAAMPQHGAAGPMVTARRLSIASHHHGATICSRGNGSKAPL
jgi:hypothetical protein